MNKVILLFLISLSIHTISSVQDKAIYHVVSKKTSLRAAPKPGAKEYLKLKMHANLELLAKADTSTWAKVRHKGQKGYVLKEDIKLGKAVVNYQMVRVGAFCKDGTSSKAIGRGACSGHGGVRKWKEKRKRTVSVIDNQ